MLNHIFLKKHPRKYKILMAILMDFIFAILATIFTFTLRFDTFSFIRQEYFQIILVSCGIFIPLFIYLRLYQAVFRYSDLNIIYRYISALLIYSSIFLMIFTIYGVDNIPRSIGVLQPLLFSLAVIFSRVSIPYWAGDYFWLFQKRIKKRAIIYGAGEAGRQLASGINQSSEMRVVGYLDDDVSLHGHSLNGLEIYNPKKLSNVIVSKKITHILLAMPSISKARRNQIFEMTSTQGLKVLSLPRLSDLSSDKITASDLKELRIDDLLGRDPAKPDPLLFCKNIRDKVVLVTGAGGSIGSELCRQILLAHPRKLLLIESSEYALYSIYQDLQKIKNEKNLMSSKVVPLLANILDEVRVEQIIETFRPQTIFHAAAFKHVPLVEQNPTQGLLNNVWGTLNVGQLALKNGVENFVLISTDKAVRPTNIMGASKRIAEMVVQVLSKMAIEKKQKTCFSMVRFGNVLGSSGSVVPLFQKQIASGGPITITDKEVTRYFMSINEAAQLVIQASAMAEGGDLFLLDMGNSIKILDLALKMIELSGLTVLDQDNPNGDIEIKIVGLRYGEKLYEELLISGNSLPTQHPRIIKANENFEVPDNFFITLKYLKSTMDQNNIPLIREIIDDLIEGYQMSGEVVDLISLERS